MRNNTRGGDVLIIKKKVEPNFVDERGQITNLLEEPINSVVLITSEPGAVRANHFHKEDTHYCYVLSGEMVYHEVDADDVVHKETVKEGEMVFTPPGRPHAMYFPVRTTFLALTSRKRLGGKYEEDTVRCKII